MMPVLGIGALRTIGIWLCSIDYETRGRVRLLPVATGFPVQHLTDSVFKAVVIDWPTRRWTDILGDVPTKHSRVPTLPNLESRRL